MSKDAKPVITKIEGAQRQLDFAIRAFFEDGDSLAIHTLAHAAFKVLYDLYPKRLQDGFAAQLNDLIDGYGWRRFNHVPNFLKHADNDADAVLDNHSANAVEATLGLATLLHHRITGRMTAEMRAFDAWMHIMHPEGFVLPPDPDPNFEKAFRESVSALKDGPRDAFLRIGTEFITFYRENPSVGGFGAPREPESDAEPGGVG
jgi:hypothetical protein